MSRLAIGLLFDFLIVALSTLLRVIDWLILKLVWLIMLFVAVVLIAAVVDVVVTTQRFHQPLPLGVVVMFPIALSAIVGSVYEIFIKEDRGK